MPCTDGGVPYPPTREEELNAKAPAMLCAVLTVLESQGIDRQVIARMDWKEAGVSPLEFAEWWAIHKRRDTDRRAIEAQTQRRRELRAAALSKLSLAERQALGIGD